MVNYIIFTPDMEDCSFVRKHLDSTTECISVLDARSAVYVATGICAQNKERVVVCVDSGNASRSAFSGMTEAFYRNLPVALVTFGNTLDYNKELGDVITKHFIVDSEDDIDKYLDNDGPIHIEVCKYVNEIKKYECNKLLSVIGKNLDQKDYLYIGTGIDNTDTTLKCKVVNGFMKNCFDGSLANILGASLAKKRSRYVGLLSEEEFLHDINTLGNININNSLFFIVATEHKNNFILDFCKSLGFCTESFREDMIDEECLKLLVNNKTKTVLMVYRED